MRERGLARGYPARSTMQLLERDIREGRRKFRRVSQNGLNRSVAQHANVMCLVVIVPSWRPGVIEETLHFQVRSRLDEICNGLRKLPQRLQDLFTFIGRSAVADDRTKRRTPIWAG